MTEIFAGIEGDWERDDSNSSYWNDGIWRSVEITQFYYNDGRAFDSVTGETSAYDSLGSTNYSKHWERFVPVVKLPTEPGIYRANSGTLWMRDESGTWAYLSGGIVWKAPTWDPASFLPFVFVSTLND